MIEDSIVQLISQVGFPIAAFLLMYYQSSTTIKENTKAIKELKTLIYTLHRNNKL